MEDEELSLHLTELERNLATVFSDMGTSHAQYGPFFFVIHLDFKEYFLRFRSPKCLPGSNEAFGFLDGDFLERYFSILDDPGKLKKVLEGGSVFEKLKISQQEIQELLEQLQRLH